MDSNPPIITGKKTRRKMRARLKMIAREFSTKAPKAGVVLVYLTLDYLDDGVINLSPLTQFLV